MPEKSNIDHRILNQLEHGKTYDGMVGAVVAATGDNPNNKAWITVVMKKGVDYRNEQVHYYFLHYEIEYLEFSEIYEEELHGYDWDMFLIRTEKYYNIKDEIGLEKLLKKWLADVNTLKPVANIGLPNR